MVCVEPERTVSPGEEESKERCQQYKMAKERALYAHSVDMLLLLWEEFFPGHPKPSKQTLMERVQREEREGEE